jgi:hypothetical protein
MCSVPVFFLVHLLEFHERLDGYQSEWLRRRWKADADAQSKALYDLCEARMNAMLGHSIWRDAKEQRTEA